MKSSSRLISERERNEEAFRQLQRARVKNQISYRHLAISGVLNDRMLYLFVDRSLSKSEKHLLDAIEERADIESIRIFRVATDLCRDSATDTPAVGDFILQQTRVLCQRVRRGKALDRTIFVDGFWLIVTKGDESDEGRVWLRAGLINPASCEQEATLLVELLSRLQRQNITATIGRLEYSLDQDTTVKQLLRRLKKESDRSVRLPRIRTEMVAALRNLADLVEQGLDNPSKALPEGMSIEEYPRREGNPRQIHYQSPLLTVSYRYAGEGR